MELGDLPATLLQHNYKLIGTDAASRIIQHLERYPDLCFSVKDNSIIGSILTSYSYLAFELKLYKSNEDVILEAQRKTGDYDEFIQLYKSIIDLF